MEETRLPVNSPRKRERATADANGTNLGSRVSYAKGPLTRSNATHPVFTS